MEQKNRKITAYSKVRLNFYKQIEEIEKKNKRKIILLALATLLLASTLLFVSTLIETSGKGKYTYIYGDYEQSINTELCFNGEIQFIDMNALANYCGFDKEEVNYVATFSVNNTYISFENDSKIAIINGIKKEMPDKAQIKNGYCLIPLSTANEILYGIEITSEDKSSSIKKSSQNMYIIEKNLKAEYLIDASTYLEYINSNDEYIHILVNKQNPIDATFEAENLVEISNEYLHSYKHKSVVELQETALKAIEFMMQNMRAEGITDIYIQSAHRTYDYQNYLFNKYIQDEMSSGLSQEKAEEKVLTYSSRPGESEHHTGLCVDFTTNSINGAVDDVFESTEAFTWLKANAWKYGFILRYPEDKTAITGYSYESWHYRFVGLEVASIMHQTGLCYEEYLEIFGE